MNFTVHGRLDLSAPLELLRSLSVRGTPLPDLPRYDRDPPAVVEVVRDKEDAQ